MESLPIQLRGLNLPNDVTGQALSSKPTVPVADTQEKEKVNVKR